MKQQCFFLIPVLFVFGCNNAEERDAFDYRMNFDQSQNQSSEMNRFLFDGNWIELVDKKITKNKVELSVQEISQKGEDLTFRAKRIPKEMYLLNQGIEADELSAALEDLKNEQLFYFEFEEEQKQDLMKKYFSENADEATAYMAFAISADFLLITESGDSIPASYSMYERSYHVSPFEKIVLGFNYGEEKEKVRLVYNDNLFGKGKFEFSFPSGTYVETMLNKPYVTANQN